MDWTERAVVGLTLPLPPSKELHAVAEDGTHVVALLVDERLRGGARWLHVRAYGGDPATPLSTPLNGPDDGDAREGGVRVLPWRYPTLEELREAVDQLTPTGSLWCLGGLQTFLRSEDAGTVYRETSEFLTSPIVVEATQPADASTVDPRGIVGPSRLVRP